MSKLIRGLVGGVLVASVVTTSHGAEPETCVADNQQTCPSIIVSDGAGAALDDSAVTPEVNLPGVSAPADQTPSVTTRTIGPPIVVTSPFSQAAPAAAQTEDLRPLAPGEQRPLPPGPPNRLP